MDNKKYKKDSTTKKPYKKPTIESEELITFGARCNGSTSGGRKSTITPPANCNASKLLS